MKPPEQEKKLRAQQEAFLQHIYLLKKITEDAPDIKDSLKMMYLLYSSRITESADTLLLLSVHNKLNDCYAISRMILETSTNITFIASKPQELIDKSLEYALQKIYRDLDRNLTIGNLSFGIKFSDIENIEKTEKLDNSLKKFTNPQTGEEIRDWTGVDKKSITQKIEQITKIFGDNIGIAFVAPMFAIYRHSSEILHGTTFGAMHNVGLTGLRHEIPETPESIKEYQEKTLANIIMSLNLLLNCVIKIYLQKYPNDIYEAERKGINELISKA